SVNQDLALKLVAFIPPHPSILAITLGGTGAAGIGSSTGVAVAVGGALAANVTGNVIGNTIGNAISPPPSIDVLGNVIGPPGFLSPHVDVLANIDSSTVQSGGGIALTASSSANVLALAAGYTGSGAGGGTVGVTVGVAGSVAGNVAGEIIQASITCSNP